MTATARRGELTLERFLADVEQGVLDDRLDTYMPPDLYGPPTAAELAAAARSSRASSKAVLGPAAGRYARTERTAAHTGAPARGEAAGSKSGKKR